MSEQEVEESDHETGSEFAVDTEEDLEAEEEEDEDERNNFPISKSGMRWSVVMHQRRAGRLRITS